SATTFRNLFVRIPNMRLMTLPMKVIFNMTVDNCANYCVYEVEFECKSFDVENVNKECHLHNHSHNEPLFKLQEEQFVDHYRTAYEKLFNRLPNHYLTTRHKHRVAAISTEECARRCILEMAFKCRGFDYENNLRNCWLTDKTPSDVDGVKIRPDTDYYERIADGPCSNFINYGYGALQPLEGIQIYNKVVLGVTLDACAHLCQSETFFKCNSFDYVFTDQSCQMSQYIAANVHGLMTSYEIDHKIMHYEAIGDYLRYFYATPHASILGKNEKTFKRITPDSCARKCLEERDFICRSFDYQITDGTCLLSTVTGSDVGGLYSPPGASAHHFEMKPSIDCGGTLTDLEGMLASPNWPRHYLHHLNCTWQIVVPKHRIIRVELYHLDLGPKGQDPCDEHSDVLSFMDDVNGNEDCVASNLSEYVSHTNKLLIRFVTNANHDANGFRMFYTADWPCNTTFTEDDGQFATLRWPRKYPSKTSCVWSIQAPLSCTILLRFTLVELEDHVGSSCSTAYDVIEVFDGDSDQSKILKAFCGVSAPVSFNSSGNFLYIKFRSDNRVQMRGFHAAYKFIFPPYVSTTTVSPSTEEWRITSIEEGIKSMLTDSNNETHIYTSRQWNITNEELAPLVADFVESMSITPISDSEVTKTTNNPEKCVEGDEGDDVVDVNYHDNHEHLQSILVCVIVIFVLLFVIGILASVIIYRHYRKKSPKRRQTPYIKSTEENVSLCKNGHAAGHEQGIENDDKEEEIDFFQPSSSNPPADVEFQNPLYNFNHEDVSYLDETNTS
ncbi:hypothetical protein ACJMK2_039656, partial [Sinanodonta woodiana]